MQIEYLLLEEKIKSIAGSGPVYYLANPGNWGDGLIRAGSIKFFKDIDLKYKELTLNKKEWILPFMTGGTVIYGGGGAWCDYWNEGEKYISKLQKRFKIIVLPSSYEKHYSYPGNVTFFSRDKHESLQNMPNSEFCHDMAFYLGKMEAPKGSGVGYFFRTDVESSNKIEIPSSNRDISLEGHHYSEMYPFLKAISEYEVIQTDRLHVAIAGALLGREVHLYPGSYFKIRAIYESSIKDYFDNVKFHLNSFVATIE